MKACLALYVLVAAPLFGSTYTVNSLLDTPDAAPGNDVCATAGAVCTLRAAIQEANAHAGPDTIAFGIAGIIAPATAYPALTQPTTIAGSTAPGYSSAPVVVVDGLGAVATGIHFAAGSTGSLLDALHVRGFSDAGVDVEGSNVILHRNYVGTVDVNPNQDGIEVTGSGHTVGSPGLGNVIFGNTQYGLSVSNGTGITIQSNVIGLDATEAVAANGWGGLSIENSSGVILGGAGAGEGNTLSGNLLGGRASFLSASTILGNTFGLTTDRTAARPNTIGLVLLNSANVAVGSVGAGRNVFSGNHQNGLIVDTATNVDVIGNYIGTDGTGMIAIPNPNSSGLSLLDLIDSDVASNVVSGNFGGIFFSGSSARVRLYGNIVGRNAANTAPMPNQGTGIGFYHSVEDITLGSEELGGNIVANNARFGVEMQGTNAIGVRVMLEANSIYDNGWMGFRLDGPGSSTSTPSTNDLQDADTGDNGLQNYPIVTSAINSGTSTIVRGTLNSTPSTTFTIHFYANVSADPSGFGEGQTYLEKLAIATDANGNAAFVAEVAAVPVNQFITATATGPEGTSEFSNARAVGAPPAIQFTSLPYSSGESTDAFLVLTRSGDVSGVSTVDVATSAGTAMPGVDYVETATTVTFAPGQTSRVALVPVHFDTADEPPETFFAMLSNPTLATLSVPFEATVTITDDDPPAVAVSDVSLAEAELEFVFTVTLSRAQEETFEVSYQTDDGTATAGSDYDARSGVLKFAPGVTTAEIRIPVHADALFEQDETFAVRVAAGGDGEGTGTIENDDTAPTLSIGDVTQSEGDGGVTTFTFPVILSEAAGAPVSVAYTTVSHTAFAPDDYQATSGILTLPPGTTALTIVVTVTGDATFEGDEQFRVLLSNPEGATLSDGEAIGTITNDDAATTPIPTLSEWVLLVFAAALGMIGAMKVLR